MARPANRTADPARGQNARTRLLTGPIPATMVRLSLPNIVLVGAQVDVSIAAWISPQRAPICAKPSSDSINESANPARSVSVARNDGR